MSKEDKTENNVAAESEEDQHIAAVARRLRHIGYAIFGGLALVAAICLAYCIVTDMENHDVRDPMTGERVTEY